MSPPAAIAAPLPRPADVRADGRDARRFLIATETRAMLGSARPFLSSLR